MKIKCTSCGNEEKINAQLIGSIVGSATAGAGMLAWTSFFFAGTGFAAAICTAIVAGGPAVYAYREEIIKWLVDKGYKCQKCGGENWVAIQDEKVEKNKKNNTRVKSEGSGFELRLKKLEIKLSKQKNAYNTESIVYIGGKINDMNSYLIKELCKLYKIDSDGLSQSKRIGVLKEYLSKDLINNLYSINTIRNKIIHPDDFGLDLNSLSDSERDHIILECNMAIKNMRYVYEKTFL
jgi:DNA-directed RNA polymerase subunit RPC12/RpoP